MSTLRVAIGCTLFLSSLLLLGCGAGGAGGGGTADVGVAGGGSAQVLVSVAGLPAGLDPLVDVEVVDVHDGDTITVVDGGETVIVRLYGVDSPETDQEYGDEARRFADGLLADGPVDVHLIPGEETYGRKVGIVVAGDRILNAALLDAGLAWHYARYCDRDPPCDTWKTLADAARSAGTGLWADPAPMAPWDWRRIH